MPFFLFNILPVLFGVYVSFTRWSIVGAPKWVGVENFTKAFTDHWVGIAFKNVFLYGLIIVPCVTVLGLLFALFVNRRYPLSSLARTLFFAPTVVSATVIGLVWVWLLDTQFGLVNHYLGFLGIDDDPLAHLDAVVAGRRQHRLDLVGSRASPSCCSWRPCRIFRARSSTRRGSTAPGAGSASGM